MHVTFSRQENNFGQNYDILDLDNFQVRLQYWVASLCNQLLPRVFKQSIWNFAQMYMHIEDVHVTFSRQENNYGQNYGILDLDDFQAGFQ